MPDTSNTQTANVSPTALTSERPSFDRQTGLASMVPKLSLDNWDVDPNLVEQRLKYTGETLSHE